MSPENNVHTARPTLVETQLPGDERRAKHKSVRRLSLWSIMLAGVIGASLCLIIAGFGYSLEIRPGTVTGDQAVPPPRVIVQKIMPPNPPPGGERPEPHFAPVGPLPTGVVNILLLGKDERPDEIEADAAGRTDSMMVLRIDFDHRRAKLLSIPRDMLVALPNLEAHDIAADKINTAYHYGELYDLPGGGPKEAMDTVTLNFGIPIDHYGLIDFQGFVNLVDALGGIDIDVPKAIQDYRFPTDDYEFTTFTVEAGPQHMDGLTALRYARTRNPDTDIERIKRQHLVLMAIRDKALTVDALRRAPDIYDALAGSFETDMNLATLISYGLAGQQIDRSNITTFVLENAEIDRWAADSETGIWIPQRSVIAPTIEAFMAGP
jgi:LCP family protein required for cell wall assembly